MPSLLKSGDQFIVGRGTTTHKTTIDEIKNYIGGSTGSTVIVSDTAPDITGLEEGTLWWDSDEGDLFILYNDSIDPLNPNLIWVDATNHGNSDSREIIYSDSAPVTGDFSGQLWVKTSSCPPELYIWDGDCEGDGGKWTVVKQNAVTKITPGPGVSVDPASGTGDVTINNTGVTKIVAGAGIAIDPAGGTGNVEITNTLNTLIFSGQVDVTDSSTIPIVRTENDLYINVGTGQFTAEWAAITENADTTTNANPGDYMVKDSGHVGLTPWTWIGGGAPPSSDGLWVEDSGKLYPADLSNKVGIGTNVPQSELVVRGSVPKFTMEPVADTQDCRIQFCTTDGTVKSWVQGGGKLASAIRFGQGSSERMRIAEGGNVGIGTDAPAKQLHINSSLGILVEDKSMSGPAPDIEVIGKRDGANVSPSFGGKLLLSGNRADASVPDKKSLGTVLFGGNHTDGSMANILYTASVGGIAEGAFTNSTTMPTGLAFYTGSTGYTSGTANIKFGTERMRIGADGNVGIGIDNPGQKLVVKDDVSAQIQIKTTDKGELRLISASDADGHAIRFGGDTAGGTQSKILRFITTGDNERMRIDPDGNVGIGTDDPQHKLDVSGDLAATNYRIDLLPELV